jgi:hypothetical protein
VALFLQSKDFAFFIAAIGRRQKRVDTSRSAGILSASDSSRAKSGTSRRRNTFPVCSHWECRLWFDIR